MIYVGDISGSKQGMRRGYLQERRNQLDPDTINFFNSCGWDIDGYIIKAVNDLVTDFKDANFYSRYWYGYTSSKKTIYATYPFVGGTASKHKWNLCDPRDLDAAFRLTFSGGMTHDANGITGNGTNAYYNTNLNVNSVTQLNNVSAWAYSRTNLARANDCLLSTVDGLTNAIFFNPRNATDNFSLRINTSVHYSYANTDSRGLFGASRLMASGYKAYKNKVEESITEASTAKQNDNILGMLFALTYSQRNQAFAAIGEGLTTAQQSDWYDIIQAFQTTLGRQV